MILSSNTSMVGVGNGKTGAEAAQKTRDLSPNISLTWRRTELPGKKVLVHASSCLSVESQNAFPVASSSAVNQIIGARMPVIETGSE